LENKEAEIVSLIQDSRLDDIYKAQLLYVNMKRLHSLKAVGESRYEAAAAEMILELEKLPKSRSTHLTKPALDEQQRIITMLEPEIDKFVETRVKHNLGHLDENLMRSLDDLRSELPAQGGMATLASISHSVLGSLIFVLLLTALTHAGFLDLFFDILRAQVLSSPEAGSS